jgi:hypothetical protein
MVFPEMRPGSPWGEYVFSVSNAPKSAKDFSVQCAGVHGNIQGARIDRIICDDILDWENTLTQNMREDLIAWWPTVVGRITDGGRVRFLANAFHPQDLAHHLARSGNYAFRKYPVHRDGESIWPERWPWHRIIAKAEELGPRESKRLLMVEAIDDGQALFSSRAIDVALMMGDGTELCSALAAMPPGFLTFTGVDLAVSKRDSADTTCLFTIAVERRSQQRSVLNIERGRWSGPEIVRRIIDTHRRFMSAIWVENNAAQDYIRQFVSEREPIPVKGFTTGRNKAHPDHGIPGLATEMEQGRWRVPNDGGKCHPLVRQWLDELLYYDPASHTGDAAMASWFAREAARQSMIKVGSVRSTDLHRR